MPAAHLMNNILRLQRELADLSNKISQEAKKENDCNKRILQIDKSITKNTSASLVTSKLNQIQRKNDEIVRIQKRKAALVKKEADKSGQLNKYKIQAAKQEERERKKVDEIEKKRRKEQLAFQREITNELKIQKSIPPKENILPDVKYDIFISHASEDKDDIVRPLVSELKRLDFKVWYDESALKVGDSLRRSIDKGLTNSRYGAVILSPSFFAKNWPQYELDGLVAREMNGRKVILPIWHRITKDEVLNYSPTLADKVSLHTSLDSIEKIAAKLAEVLKEI